MKNSERMYHIGLTKDDLCGARHAILPGDPGRVEKIASLLCNPRKIGVNREYTSYLGELKGQNVLVISTGMGGPSTAICVEELALLGVEYYIRVGTCGGMQMDVLAGDIVIAQGAIRQEGTSREYLPIEYPATADFDCLLALRESAEELGASSHMGVVQCKDSFYGQHSPETMPIAKELESKWKAWIAGGALASEMETAALYTVCSVRRLHGAAVLLVVWNQEREAAGLGNDTKFDMELAIKVAIKAIEKLL